MKKIALVLLVISASIFVFAQDKKLSVTDNAALKERVAQLEMQVKTDVQVISALRKENRELKQQIRQMKRGVGAAEQKVEKPVTEKETQLKNKREEVSQKAQDAQERADDGTPKNVSAKSSSGFQMFPF